MRTDRYSTAGKPRDVKRGITADEGLSREKAKTVPHQSGRIALGYQIMATLACTDAERLLRAYLQAIRHSNRATQDYARVLKTGPRGLVKATANIAGDVTDRLRDAREAFQVHVKRHRC